jgi:hypothetical protein
VCPVLVENCFACHTSTKLGGLQLASREHLLQGGGRQGAHKERAAADGIPEDLSQIVTIVGAGGRRGLRAGRSQNRSRALLHMPNISSNATLSSGDRTTYRYFNTAAFSAPSQDGKDNAGVVSFAVPASITGAFLYRDPSAD